MKREIGISGHLKTGCLIAATALAVLAGAAVPGEPGPLPAEPVAVDPRQEAMVLPAAACTDRVVRRVRAPATAESPSVEIDCSLTLRREDVITKRLLVTGWNGNGVRIDCSEATLYGGVWSVNGNRDMIEIRSRATADPDVWQRPTNVVVRDCNIVGSIRVHGMARNGEGAALRESSRRAGHTQRARDNAPKHVVLDNLTVTAVSRTPVYFAPGVSHSSLLNSELRGEAKSVAVYLDAESTANTIENNYIHVSSHDGREQVAVDGSSYNWIINNRFSALDHGGIYLYRNCGEGGTIRHETPRHNTVVNNVFYYDAYDGPNPAVYVGSRNGDRDYCHEDEDGARLYGSSVSDMDFARYNVVMQNQIYKRSPSEMIRAGNAVLDRPNYIGHNETVTSATSRRAGCFVGATSEPDFILDGQRIEIGGVTRTCVDGGLE